MNKKIDEKMLGAVSGGRAGLVGPGQGGSPAGSHRICFNGETGRSMDAKAVAEYHKNPNKGPAAMFCNRAPNPS